MSIFQAATVLKNEFAKLIEHDDTYIHITSFKFYKKSRTLAALNVTYTTLEDINSDEDIKVQLASKLMTHIIAWHMSKNHQLALSIWHFFVIDLEVNNWLSIQNKNII